MNITRKCYLWAMCLLPFAALAQGDYWQRTYNDGLINLPMAVAARDGSGYVAVNYVDQPPNRPYGLILKTDRRGIVISRRTDTLLYRSISTTQDSGFLVVGYADLSGYRYLQKWDKQHRVEWTKSLGAWWTTAMNIGTAIQTADLDYTVYGNKIDSLWIQKIDRSGNTRWTKTWYNAALSGQHLIELPDGGFLLRHNHWGGNVPADSVSSLIRTDALGNVQWTKSMRHSVANNIAIQNGRITYATTTLTLHQLDLSGNTIRATTHPWRAPLFAKRRLGGYWLTYQVEDPAAGAGHYAQHLARLDSNAHVLADYRTLLGDCWLLNITETNDSTLFVQGYKNGQLFMATMDAFGQQSVVSGITDPTPKSQIRMVSYPNPMVDRALLEILDGNGTEDNTTRTFQLLDVTGRVVRQANFNGNQYAFERADLNGGFYLFRVTQNGQLLGTGNIVIQ